MKTELLNDSYSIKEAVSLQKKYRSEIQKERISKLNIQDLNTIKKVVGLDIAYFNKQKEEIGIACAVLWDIREEKIIEKEFFQAKINFPYIAGFLGFRECKLLANALLKLRNDYDIAMCDGHGNVHPRRFGEAVQLGVALDIPTIGIAKSPYIGYSDWELMERKKGIKVPIWKYNPNKEEQLPSQEILGYAICLRDGSKPVFVSEGYNVDISLALEIALKTSNTQHRLPEPLFLADFYSKQKLRNSEK
ncbi:MAG: endonuclease V [Promethearchaeota archaeon]|nr:MAG: endonuclease V [Candidatus Lokiarchaeota archaeon]